MPLRKRRQEMRQGRGTVETPNGEDMARRSKILEREEQGQKGQKQYFLCLTMLTASHHEGDITSLYILTYYASLRITHRYVLRITYYASLRITHRYVLRIVAYYAYLRITHIYVLRIVTSIRVYVLKILFAS